ncbi:PEP/pyruvate-binding domain-containing protein [Actinomadura nitritigenes]|uniref:PEP/pyruvate-binding domain-containing protein n=1 Tax=Actinomadura nitritigenes TaxID=134602 RepID=UPI003D8F0C43
MTVPDDAMSMLRAAVRAVFSSWNNPRAVTHGELHGVPHDLGTAVIVQAMVFGNREGRSGTGVAFSRDPNTGGRTPFGDVLFGGQGEDVVSGRARTRPLSELADREPAVWERLVAALRRISPRHLRGARTPRIRTGLGIDLLTRGRGACPGVATGRVAVTADRAVRMAAEGPASPSMPRRGARGSANASSPKGR